MNIKDIINKIFKKNNGSFDIVNLNSLLINTPSKDKLTEEELKILDNYKNEYKEILKQRKHLVSNDLDTNNLLNRELILVDILFNICLNRESISDVIDIISLVDKEKLKLYLQDIIDIEKEVSIKLIALDEILKKDILLSYNKKNSIKDTINNLINILVVIQNQKTSIAVSLNAYITDIENNYIINKEKYSDYDIRLNNYKDDLAKIIIPDYKLIFNNSKKYYELSIKDIAKMEKELEIFVYTHKEEMDKYRSELEKLDLEDKTKENKEDLYKKIIKLEQLFQIFDTYGRNIVKEEDYDYLYRVKFDIKTIDLYSLNSYSTPFGKYNEIELKIYENIIMEKIEAILMKYNPYIEKIFGDDMNKAISYISAILKSNSTGYDAHHILSDGYLLKLLLSFDKEDGLAVFYNSFMESDILTMPGLVNGLKYNNPLPLNTIYEIGEFINEELYKSALHNYFFDSSFSTVIGKNTYSLYKLYKPKALQDEDIYKLPEGIVEMDLNRIRKDNVELYAYIMGKAYFKHTLLLPSSLRKMDNTILKAYKEIILNDGLEEINNTYFDYIRTDSINSITIPASLKKIDNNVFCHREINYLIFKDFKNSKILNNRNELRKIIRSIIEKMIEKNKELNIQLEKEFKKNNLNEGDKIPLLFDESSLPVKNITLLDEENKAYDIHLSNLLKITKVGMYNWYYKEKREEKNAVIVIGKLRLIYKFINNLYDEIEKITGYKIEKKETTKKKQKILK